MVHIMDGNILNVMLISFKDFSVFRAYLLSLSTKSGPSEEGEVEHSRRISESEYCCNEEA